MPSTSDPRQVIKINIELAQVTESLTLKARSLRSPFCSSPAMDAGRGLLGHTLDFGGAWSTRVGRFSLALMLARLPLFGAGLSRYRIHRSVSAFEPRRKRYNAIVENQALVKLAISHSKMSCRVQSQ